MRYWNSDACGIYRRFLGLGKSFYLKERKKRISLTQAYADKITGEVIDKWMDGLIAKKIFKLDYQQLLQCSANYDEVGG
ncbi:MAG: hypothetical protein FWB86_13370 [Treponema sp.]|nr:hypothetical protein [Treponema sp.]MCL2251492.1 hypothetical protein [Treponema sp.]